MANPIFTFQDKNTKNRYFFLWDTYWGLPKTIPMNLLTFLQYWGIRNKEKISALYSIYPRLAKLGSSLLNNSFDQFPNNLKKVCFDYLGVVDTPDEAEKYINDQLEQLFESDLNFFEFYTQYAKLVSEINRLPKRPINYYHSWSRTSEIFNLSAYNYQEILEAVLVQHGSDLDELNFDLDNVHSWLENNIFERFPEVMVDFFVQLAKSNLIAIDAIPHIVRNNQTMMKLFNQFGMEAYVPEDNVAYNVFDLDQPVYELVNDERFFRQFVNLLTFDGQELELMGFDLLEKPMSELSDMLRDFYYITNLQLVNLKDNHGNYLLPMKYTNNFQVKPNDQFLFLAPFGRQAYHVVHRFGAILDSSGYYDFYTVGNIGYMQYSQDLSWVRWSYDEETSTIDKQPVTVEDPYQEGILELTEQRFQQGLLKDNNANKQDEFELLELVFGKQDNQYSIYLSMLNRLNRDTIESEIIFHLNALLGKGIDISDSYTASFALYKSLLVSQRVMKFIPPSLNVFYLVDNLIEVTSKFVNNYHNDDFLDELNDGYFSDRSVISHLSLLLMQDRGHYSVIHQYHFKSNNSAFAFQKECEEFVQSNPLISESDLGAYAKRFLDYLLEKKYQQVYVFSQNLDKNTIVNLLGIELNQEGRFDIPERLVIDPNDDDDLPF